MWFWRKNKLRDAVVIKILEGMRNLNKRLRRLEAVINETNDAVEKLAKIERNLEWDEKAKNWKEAAHEAVPYDGSGVA